jgi:hypothetical protein
MVWVLFLVNICLGLKDFVFNTKVLIGIGEEHVVLLFNQIDPTIRYHSKERIIQKIKKIVL